MLLQSTRKNLVDFFEIKIMRKFYDTYCKHRCEVEIQNFSWEASKIVKMWV